MISTDPTYYYLPMFNVLYDISRFHLFPCFFYTAPWSEDLEDDRIDQMIIVYKKMEKLDSFRTQIATILNK